MLWVLMRSADDCAVAWAPSWSNVSPPMVPTAKSATSSEYSTRVAPRSLRRRRDRPCRSDRERLAWSGSALPGWTARERAC